MALDIWLASKFDIGDVYNFVRKYREFEKVSDLERGRFTFHLRGVSAVTFQIYSGGSIHLSADDYSRYTHLLSILASILEHSTGSHTEMHLIRYAPSRSTNYDIARLAINDELSNSQGSSMKAIREIAKDEAERISEVRDFINNHNQTIIQGC